MTAEHGNVTAGRPQAETLKSGRRLGSALGAASTLIVSSALLLGPAYAGSCPSDKTVPGARASGETMPKGVSDAVLGMVDLAAEKAAIKDRRLRLRKLVIQPGGIVPWHSHEDRPAIIYIVSGSIQEFASNCTVPITHKAGDVSIEKLGVQHWWKNNTKTPVVLLSADLFHSDMHEDEHMM